MKLSQTATGIIGAVSKTTQVFYESGKRSPDARYLAALADAGFDVAYVVTGRQSLPSPVIPKVLSEIIGSIESHLLKSGQSLTVESRSEITALFYAQSLASGAVDHSLISGHLSLVCRNE